MTRILKKVARSVQSVAKFVFSEVHIVGRRLSMIVSFKGWSLVAVIFAAATFGGCAQSAPAPVKVEVAAGHSHDGWWCGEHGVPEEECGLCNPKKAAELQKNGDWCKEHQRPDSQCFVCHPELEAKFAARYEAKYGQPPPKTGHGHDHVPGQDHGHKHEPKS